MNLHQQISGSACVTVLPILASAPINLKNIRHIRFVRKCKSNNNLQISVENINLEMINFLNLLFINGDVQFLLS